MLFIYSAFIQHKFSSVQFSSTHWCLVDSKEALSRNVTLVEERLNGSLRDLLRAFTMNPAAYDSVLRDDSLVQGRSESANEIIRELKVGVGPVIGVCSGVVKGGHGARSLYFEFMYPSAPQTTRELALQV